MAGERFSDSGIESGATPPPTLIQINPSGRSFGATTGDYDPGDLVEIDKAIRHSPAVVDYTVKMAQKGIEETGSENFDVILQNRPDTERPRAYMAPINAEGIHEELSESTLLKTAINLEGQGP